MSNKNPLSADQNPENCDLPAQKAFVSDDQYSQRDFAQHAEQKTAPAVKAKGLSPFTQLKNKSAIACQGPIIPSRIRVDFIYGETKWSCLAQEVSKHPMFARLSKIKQLGTLQFHPKYRNAIHTRFDHSCQVAYLARVAAETVQRQFPQVTNKLVVLIELAGLLHDVGHGPYSHSYDKMLEEIKLKSPAVRHEYRSQVIAREILQSIVDSGKDFGVTLEDSDIRLIQFLIDQKSYREHFAKKETNPNEVPECVTSFIPGMEHFISSDVSVDVDKMAYLALDTIMLKWEQHLNKQIDVVKIIKRTRVINGTWAFNFSDYSAVYNLVCRRFIFYTNIYTCAEAVVYDSMITDALIKADAVMKFSTCSRLETKEQIDIFCGLTDSYLIESILNAQEQALSESESLLRRVLNNKNLYKKVGEFHSATGVSNDTHVRIDTNINNKSAPLNLLPLISLHINNVLSSADTMTSQSLYTKN